MTQRATSPTTPILVTRPTSPTRGTIPTSPIRGTSPTSPTRANSTTSRTSLEEKEAFYKTTANQLTGYLYSEITEFCNIADEQTDTTCVGKWRFESLKKGVTVYKSASQFQNKNPCLLGHIKMRCQPEYIACSLLNPETRYYYDNSLKDTQLLQVIDDNLKLYYTSFQTKKCIVNYTVSLCNIAAHRKVGDTFMAGYCSVPPHTNMIVETGVPTVWLYYSGFVIRPTVDEDGNDCSQVFYIFQFDYSGDLPSFVINFAMERQMVQLAYIKLVMEKCLLSPAFSDSGDSLNTAGISRQNSSSSKGSVVSGASRQGSQKNLLRIPSNASLGSVGFGRRDRVGSYQSAKSFRVSPSRSGCSSPPLSMKSVSDSALDNPRSVLFYVDSSDEEETFRSSESLMRSIEPRQIGFLPDHLFKGVSRQESIFSTESYSSQLFDYENIAKNCAANLFRDYIDIVESVRFSTVQNANVAWKVIDQRRGVWIMENTNSKMVHICGVTRVNADCDTLIAYINDLSNKVVYDKFLSRGRVIEEVESNVLQVVHLHFKTKHCLMVQYERDACALVHVTRKDNKAIISCVSVEHPSCPVDKNVTRVSLEDSGFIVESLPGVAGEEPTCSVVYVAKVNLGSGYFPHSILWLLKRRQPLLLARIAQHFQNKDREQ